MNGEFSMSIRTKKSCVRPASSIRRRLSTQVARSTVSPSCVSLSEMLRPMPERDDLVDDGQVRPGRGIRLRHRCDAFAEIVERLRHAGRFDGARPRRWLLPTVSPAMNRRAKLPGRRIP